MYEYTGKTRVKIGKMEVLDKDLHSLSKRELEEFLKNGIIKLVKTSNKNGKQDKRKD